MNKQDEIKELNLQTQYYKGIPLRLIDRTYVHYKAKRYVINDTNQNVWIPNKHLLNDGTINPDDNIDYVFLKAKRKLEIAGIIEVERGTYGKSKRDILPK